MLRSLPLALSVLAYGAVFGVLARQTGIDLLNTGLMSALVFAGAAQFVALELWQTPPPIGAILLTTLAVNLRLILMAASIAHWLKAAGILPTLGSLAFLGDEQWALTVSENKKGNQDRAFLLGCSFTLYISWLSASLIGHRIGSSIGDPAVWGLDFAFTAVFVTLLIGLWHGREDALPWIVAAGVAIIVQVLVNGPWYILAGGLAGSLVGVWQSER